MHVYWVWGYRRWLEGTLLWTEHCWPDGGEVADRVDLVWTLEIANAHLRNAKLKNTGPDKSPVLVRRYSFMGPVLTESHRISGLY